MAWTSVGNFRDFEGIVSCYSSLEEICGINLTSFNPDKVKEFINENTWMKLPDKVEKAINDLFP